MSNLAPSSDTVLVGVVMVAAGAGGFSWYRWLMGPGGEPWLQARQRACLNDDLGPSLLLLPSISLIAPEEEGTFSQLLSWDPYASDI